MQHKQEKVFFKYPLYFVFYSPTECKKWGKIIFESKLKFQRQTNHILHTFSKTAVADGVEHFEMVNHWAAKSSHLFDWP